MNYTTSKQQSLVVVFFLNLQRSKKKKLACLARSPLIWWHPIELAMEKGSGSCTIFPTQNRLTRSLSFRLILTFIEHEYRSFFSATSFGSFPSFIFAIQHERSSISFSATHFWRKHASDKSIRNISMQLVEESRSELITGQIQKRHSCVSGYLRSSGLKL